jgi:hypothetical protein
MSYPPLGEQGREEEPPKRLRPSRHRTHEAPGGNDLERQFLFSRALPALLFQESAFDPHDEPQLSPSPCVLELMIEGPEQEALFCIEGPDEEGCVWICSSEGRDVWCHNLGPSGKVAEKLSQWQASVEGGRASFGGTQDE